jgi:hypothetical protein
MPPAAVSVKVDTERGPVRLYFTKGTSAGTLQTELGCHRIDVAKGRIIRAQGAQRVVEPRADLRVTELDDVAYGGATPAAKSAIAESVEQVAIALWGLVDITPPPAPGKPRKIIVNCAAGRHRSPACVVAFIKKYGKKPGGHAYTVNEAQALVLDTLARKVQKTEEDQPKRSPHATQVQHYFGRTVGDYRGRFEH